MKILILGRIARDAYKTQGVFVYANEVISLSLELPWLLNRPNVSCIPTGDYPCLWNRGSGRFWVEGVPGRTLIRIHAGNIIDTNNPTKDHSDGCILPGEYFEYEEGKGRICNSSHALNRIHDAMGNEEFILSIRSVL